MTQYTPSSFQLADGTLIASLKDGVKHYAPANVEEINLVTKLGFQSNQSVNFGVETDGSYWLPLCLLIAPRDSQAEGNVTFEFRYMSATENIYKIAEVKLNRNNIPTTFNGLILPPGVNIAIRSDIGIFDMFLFWKPCVITSIQEVQTATA